MKIGITIVRINVTFFHFLSQHKLLRCVPEQLSRTFINLNVEKSIQKDHP